MKFTSPEGDEPEITVIPLIDVILVLLIFFMATATFDQNSRIKVQLPEASSQAKEDHVTPLIVQIDAEGRYFVNNSEVVNSRIETLKAALEQLGGEPGDQPVVLRADARAQHQAVVTAMDALAQTGYRNLSIATVRGADAP
ncbi:MAG: biopolymer transporter ExbD [Xanthomonadales bacterium]|nr:Biopolymer transport protein ExbD [Xanthomonadales bacterium]MCC6594837.1 biopolymer transporter ExbD [Xanthomonadales bacterium]MCE7930391.1 biopolymer transporter ExbD [Xanthomonadales bacterium PRO6]